MDDGELSFEGNSKVFLLTKSNLMAVRSILNCPVDSYIMHPFIRKYIRPHAFLDFDKRHMNKK